MKRCQPCNKQGKSMSGRGNSIAKHRAGKELGMVKDLEGARCFWSREGKGTMSEMWLRHRLRPAKVDSARSEKGVWDFLLKLCSSIK